MKKLFCLCIILLGIMTYAQTNVATYTFSKTTGVTYIPITGGTKLFPSGSNLTYNDEISSAITLSSPFIFGGVAINTVYVSTNGFITFGTAPSPTTYTPLSTTANDKGAISAFGQNGGFSPSDNPQPAGNHEVRYQDLGNEFVVQWQNHASYDNRFTENLNFQIRLNYTTGVINIVYGNCTDPGSASYSDAAPQVGIRGNTSNYMNNVSPLTIYNVPIGTTCDWSNAVTGISSTSTMIFSGFINPNIKIPSGLQYTWTPGTQLPVRIFNAISATITTNSVNVTWTAAPGATGYNIQYRTFGSCDWTNFAGNPVSGTNATLTGLTEGTKYQMQIQALKGSVQSTYSHIPSSSISGLDPQVGSFMTKANCAPLIENLSFTNSTPNSATITWYAFGAYANNGYEYYYSTSPILPTNNTIPSGSAPPSIVLSNAPISGLTPNTTYYFWVRANCDGINKGAWSDTGVFTTRTLCPTSASVSNNEAGISASPTINWTAVNGAAGYKLKIGTTSNGNDVVDTDVAGNLTNYIISTPLASSTSYYYSITAYTATSTIPTTPCEIRMFKTPCDALNVPYSLDFENVVVPELPDCTTSSGWKTKQGNSAFGTNTKVLTYELGNGSANSWFFTRGVNLTAGTAYNISFKYAKGPFQEKLKVVYGTSATVAGMTNIIADYPNIINNVVNSESINFVPTVSGVYYFGFNIYSNNFSFNVLSIDDININEVANLATIEASSKDNIKVYPIPFSENINISDVTNVKSISIMNISGEILKTFNKQTTMLDLKDLISGVYMVVITMKDGSKQSVKVIKK
ncbi:hypothetical protein QFZ37_001080 [Chryseobacterium ginsenosidimutans]|uniref:fibronectin type III domain-containing protein n=1 Tax=Chryseobacterium ginsenosidimutans TaxID=687846 RepID=UPI00278235D7|nr:fibronectin type III domain-containing protein [Chryseobacterium ginsenosidimutans]MDQ0592711.1 hypothetical protein [Chryseobacterium ginsenosidimutans]